MTRSEILEAANKRGFTIEGITGRAVVSGAALDFPRVHSTTIRGVDFEISWALAERLATGKTTVVRA